MTTKTNDIMLAGFERDAHNVMRDLSAAIRDSAMWDIKERANELAKIAEAIRVRSIYLAFQSNLPAYQEEEVE
jgi:hypothetical protein